MFDKTIFVVGPTASGKSRLALGIARAMGGEVVNSDSVQIFKDVLIGSASPTLAEKDSVPHHLYNFLIPTQNMTAGKYRQVVLDELSKTTAPLIFVGGSGFYFQAIEKGMLDIPPIPVEVSNKWSAIEKSESFDEAWRELQSVDPKWCEKIKPQDYYRIGRALKVYWSTKKTMTQLQREFDQDNSVWRVKPKLKLGIDISRDELRINVHHRTNNMLASGFINEVEQLLKKYSPEIKPLQSIGYAQVVSFLENEISEKQMIEDIVTQTMRLAKRQMTWFKRDPDITWLNSGFSETDIVEASKTFQEACSRLD